MCKIIEDIEKKIKVVESEIVHEEKITKDRSYFHFLKGRKFGLQQALDSVRGNK